jgi:hypothetical protein
MRGSETAAGRISPHSSDFIRCDKQFTQEIEAFVLEGEAKRPQQAEYIISFLQISLSVTGN